ncbi:MAG: LppP/LprE family lipoprotein [Mycobacterium sp.]
MISASSALVVVGCGFSPPAPPPSAAGGCAGADSPAPDVIAAAIATLPAGPWVETARGHADDCRLQWVLTTVDGGTASSPQQVLFFDRNTPLGTPTSDPRPYITVLPSGPEAVLVQYQWLVGDEPNCCPTGLGTVRFRIGAGGGLEALDPIPDP